MVNQQIEESITDGSYLLTDGYYAVVRSDLPTEHSARSAINWLKRDEYYGRSFLYKKRGKIKSL